MRRSRQQQQVAAALLEAPDDHHWGYTLLHRTGVPSGVLYPILRLMVERGWLREEWELERVHGRPPRKYFTITEEGHLALPLLRDWVRS